MQHEFDLESVQHEFLQLYLQYTGNTESPKVMHIWSALTAASASMGRHVALPFGIGDIYPNLFVLLVGPPGTRKSQAMKYASKLVSQYTNVRFAPDDTGGQRQGLITALEGDEESDAEGDGQNYAQLDNSSNIASLTNLENLANVQVSLHHPEDAHYLFACASEFGTFMGESNSNTTRFLNKVWDGEDYHYKLRTAQQILRNPLMTIIGGTTSSDIAKILPPESIGQGFMSRWILVFAPNKGVKVARPDLQNELAPVLGETLAWLSHEMRGEMLESKAAKEYLDYLYLTAKIDLEDNRFIYYQERRHTHLMKLCMVLAALDRRYEITQADVELANNILKATECRMPEALGEFGLSPVGAAKQKMIEFLQHAQQPIAHSVLWQIMSRDMKRIDFRQAIADMLNSGKILEVHTTYGQSFVYKDDISNVVDGLLLEA